LYYLLCFLSDILTCTLEPPIISLNFKCIKKGEYTL